MRSESQKMTLSTTADPMPWMARPKAAVLPGTYGIGEQPVAGRRPRHRAPRQDVADGERPHVDAEDAEPRRRAGGEDGVGELGVGGQGGQLEQGAEDEPEEVEMPQLVELAPGAGQLGEQHVLAHEEEEQHHQRDLHVARQPRPPPRRRRRGAVVRSGLR